MTGTDGVRQFTHRFALSASQTSSLTSGSPLVPGPWKWPGRRHPLIAGRARDGCPIGIGDHQVRARRPVMPVGIGLGLVPRLLDLPARSALPRFQRPGQAVLRRPTRFSHGLPATRRSGGYSARRRAWTSGRGLRRWLHRDLRRPGAIVDHQAVAGQEVRIRCRGDGAVALLLKAFRSVATSHHRI